jgi:hypothetical protein
LRELVSEMAPPARQPLDHAVGKDQEVQREVVVIEPFVVRGVFFMSAASSASLRPPGTGTGRGTGTGEMKSRRSGTLPGRAPRVADPH